MSKLEKHYTLKEFSESYQVTRSTTLSWIDRGILKAKKIFGNWRIPQSEIDRINNESSITNNE